MGKYVLHLDDNVSEFYESIAKVFNKQTEEILQDTLTKIIETIGRKACDPPHLQQKPPC